MDQESSRIELVHVCVCEGGEGRLGRGFFLLYSIRYILSPICHIVISIFYILCTMLKVIERVETEP